MPVTRFIGITCSLPSSDHPWGVAWSWSLAGGPVRHAGASRLYAPNSGHRRGIESPRGLTRPSAVPPSMCPSGHSTCCESATGPQTSTEDV